MKQEHISEIKAIIILALGMILFASLISFVPEDLPWYTSEPNIPAHNFVRITGACVAGTLLFTFGYAAYFFVLFLFFWSWNQFTFREVRFSSSKFLSFFVMMVVLSSLFSLIGPQDTNLRFGRSGIVGLISADLLVKYLGGASFIILFMLGTLSLIVLAEILLSPIFFSFLRGLKDFYGDLQIMTEKKTATLPKVKTPKLNPPKFNIVEFLKGKDLEKVLKEKEEKEIKKLDKDADNKAVPVAEANSPVVPAPKPLKPRINIVEPAKTESLEDDEPKIIGEYHLPGLELLDDPPQIATSKLQTNLMSGAKLLEDTLATFGVIARVADVERGPAITRYELEPAPGVKVQKFTTLSDDIALAMRAAAVRIVAPIPGKNRVGIEVPNDSSAAVYLKDVLSNSQFRTSGSKLTLALGKDIAGMPMIADLSEMPHMLIAGTTGSGKTVCVNGIIMSMIFNASPDEVKFVMIDPKMVELAQYNELPHLLCPTVTDSQKAGAALHWVVGEMETRYKKLSKTGVRNIRGYNEAGHRMPYIVVIIDELADLMQVSAKTVESSITRLAQLSRAVGIHLILATQRPSVDVITGVIKANFPARISFKVASKVDSRTVLDMNGAENLLGKGDMLFIKPGDAKPTRGQCSFVKDQEIQRVIDFIKEQQKPVYDESILTQQKAGAQGGADQHDEFYDEAVKLVIETNQASVSILQRRLRLGYTRAARLIDMMEQNGVVGPYVGSKPRDILVDREQWLLENLKNNNDSQEQKVG